MHPWAWTYIPKSTSHRVRSRVSIPCKSRHAVYYQTWSYRLQFNFECTRSISFCDAQQEYSIIKAATATRNSKYRLSYNQVLFFFFGADVSPESLTPFCFPLLARNLKQHNKLSTYNPQLLSLSATFAHHLSPMSTVMSPLMPWRLIVDSDSRAFALATGLGSSLASSACLHRGCIDPHQVFHWFENALTSSRGGISANSISASNQALSSLGRLFPPGRRLCHAVST